METDFLNVKITAETEKAYQLEDLENNAVAWFPKSQINFKTRNVKTNLAVAEILLWLLNKNGWNK